MYNVSFAKRCPFAHAMIYIYHWGDVVHLFKDTPSQGRDAMLPDLNVLSLSKMASLAASKK